ncbi:MAG: GDP-mannose 4,6-dehydratase [Candidatus Thorarchaeota archaeon]|nr:GDP-mannose 4,6-dehydratase [Candidatus Thorarchaeota archaeon]
MVTGVTGQDGAYLCKLLLEKGYKVYGVYRRLSTPNFWRLKSLDILDKVRLIRADLNDSSSLMETVRTAQPDEVYHLAAQSFVGVSFEQPIYTAEVTGVGVTRLLEAVRLVVPGARFYQASTSEQFGNSGNALLSEESAFAPASPYAAAKLYGYWMTKIYRQAYNMHASNGILFNHESPLRGLDFVTRKITDTVARIHHNLTGELRLGNTSTMRDWGYAPEYVEAMWLMTNHDEPGDYVVATGVAHSVQEFAEVAFACAGMDWKDYLRIDKGLLRPLDVRVLRGDATRCRETLGWAPKTSFEQLVELMVKADIDRWKRHLDGEDVIWDAPTHCDSQPLDGSQSGHS